MDGKTFIRTVLFARAYKHGWANALLTGTACEDAVAGPFARAAQRAVFADDPEERGAAQAEMVALAETFDAQTSFVEAADRLLEKWEGWDTKVPGIRARSCFHTLWGALDLGYRHATRSGRLEVRVREGDVIEFYVSSPEERNILAVSVSPADGTFRVYSGEPNSIQAECNYLCMQCWEEYLHLRHVWAMEEAIVAFFSTEADRRLCADVLAAVHAKAAAVFRVQDESVELSRRIHTSGLCGVYLGVTYTAPRVFFPTLGCRLIKDKPKYGPPQSALWDELVGIYAGAQDCPALIPFDYNDPAGIELFQDFFELPGGVHDKNKRGVLAIFGDQSLDFPIKNGERCAATFFFAAGVTLDDVKRCAARHLDEPPRYALWEGLMDAVDEREGAFAVRHKVTFRVNSPAQSLTQLGEWWHAPGAE